MKIQYKIKHNDLYFSKDGYWGHVLEYLVN